VRVIKRGQNTIDMLKSNTVFAGGGGGMRMFVKRGDRHTSIVFFLVLLIILEVAAFQQSFGRIGYFWHIDSIHYDANFTSSGDRNNYCWKDARTQSFNFPDGELGDYRCDSSLSLIDSVLQFMKAKMGDRVDFILWTGANT